MPALISKDPAELAQSPDLWSASCSWQDLCTVWDPAPARTGLHQPEGWTRQWTATWKFGKTPVICPVRDLSSMMAAGSGPVRRFSWHTGQKHRPGLQILLSTGRHHGFESLAERDLLLALDFAAAPTEVLSQPFTLLPVVFACPEHRRLLEDHCPECDQPVRGVLPGAPTLLLPALRGHALHPAQCRSIVGPGLGRTLPTCCGFRLDRTPSHRPVAPDLIALQHKILKLLDADPDPVNDTNEPMTTIPLHYFVDLRALSHLICASWPAARHLSPSDQTAAAVDHHTASQHQQIAVRLSASPSATTQSVFDHPATDAQASAGLLSIADRILTSGAPDDVREHLRALLPANNRRASRTFWGLWVSRATPPCSDALQAAYAPLLRSFTRATRGPGATPLSARGGGEPNTSQRSFPRIGTNSTSSRSQR